MDTEHVSTLLDAVEFRLEWLADYGVRDYGVNAESVRLKYQEAADALRRSALHGDSPLIDPGPDFAALVIERDDLHFAGDMLDTLAGLDEGENTDYDRLRRLSRRFVETAGPLPADDEPRTVLVHVNIEIPRASTVTADALAEDVHAAIMAHRTTGALAHAEEVSIPLAEEV